MPGNWELIRTASVSGENRPGGQLAALVGASYGNPRLEGNGGWQEYSSEVKAVCDWYCGGDMTHMGAYVCPEVQARAEELGIRLTLMPGQLEKQGGSKEFSPEGNFEQMFGVPGSQAPELSMDISPIFMWIRNSRRTF